MASELALSMVRYFQAKAQKERAMMHHPDSSDWR
jgi:hypothetical protein